MLRRVKAALLGTAAVAVDRAAAFAMDGRFRSTRQRIAVSHEARVAFLQRIAREYPSQASLEFYPEPAEPDVTIRRVRVDGGLEIEDLTWQSGYEPHLKDFSLRYLQTRENHLALARLFRRHPARPAVIIVHGYMSGSFAVEERLWPVSALDGLGFDVALFVLPFHGLRSGPRSGVIPEFPGSDPRMTIEGFRQTVGDLRVLVRFLRSAGHAKTGLIGMSLGGYAATLAASVEAGIGFLVPVIPLASLADFAREQGSLSAARDQAQLEHELLEGLYRPVSPLSLPCRVRAERCLVIGARADRVTPIGHARQIAGHLGAPLVAWRGGHILQIGRRESFERVFNLLETVRDED